MKPFNNISRRYHNYRNRCNRKDETMKANLIYQVKEVGGLLWVTCNGVPAVPENMLNTDIIAVLKEVRSKYVERNAPDL